MWLSNSEQAKDGEAVSTLQEIGDLLRQARIQQSLSCDQLAQSLKMGSEQLQALENGDLEKLPEPVFIKAMTRRVASKLNLDCDSLISKLKVVLPAPETTNKNQSPLAGVAAAVNPERPTGPFISWQRIVFIALAIGAVTGGAVVVASQRRSLQHDAIKSATVQPAPTQASPQPISSPEDASEVISISSKQPSWLSIRNGEGKVIFEGTLSESKSLPADPGLEIYAGRPDLVLISHGDNAPKTLGRIDQVRWYQLNPGL